MNVNIILNTDIKHCNLNQAKELCEELAEETYSFVHENETIQEEFEIVQFDCKPDILEEYVFLWHNYWNDFIDYLRELYEE